MSIIGSDPFATLLYQQQAIGTPLIEKGAGGSDDLDVPQRSIVIGEVVPIVFCRRVGTVGGVLISPGATEARFENSLTNEVTAYYHLVLGQGEFDGIEVRDIFQRSCRLGSFTQTYGRRAGPWLPGNAIIDRGGSYVKPECPYYCGTGGTYAGMTTGSYVIEDVPDGDTRWDRQVHLFIRGGMHVTRLLDEVEGPSNNVADLALWLLQQTTRTPAAMIDSAAFLAAADFTEKAGFWFNGILSASANYEDWLANHAKYFLLSKSKRGGKIGIRPSLPVTADNEIDTSPITPLYTFNEDSIIPGSFEITYIPLSDRKPFCALMLWRQQPDDDIGLIRTTEIHYTGSALDGPYEQHDLSVFATSENHVVKVGANIIARRRYIAHTLKVDVRPSSFGSTLGEGDIVQVLMIRNTSFGHGGQHNFYYEVGRIGKERNGKVRLDLVHFPVDVDRRSLVALDVAAAVGGGLLLDTGKSGTSCDVNADDDITVPTDDSLDPEEWELPDDDAFDAILPDTPYGTGTDVEDGSDPGGGFGDDGGFGGEDGFGGEEGGDGESAGPDDLDDQNAITGASPGGPIPGDTLEWDGCGCDDPSIDWYRDGELIGNSATYRVTVADMNGTLVGVGKCNGVNTCESKPVKVPFTPAAYTYWRFKSSSGGASGWAPTTAFYGAFIGTYTTTSPGGLLAWYIHGGEIKAQPGTGIGGNLGQLVSITVSTGVAGAIFHSYIGSNAQPDVNGTNTVFPKPGSWEFSTSNADNGPDAWEEQWGGRALSEFD